MPSFDAIVVGGGPSGSLSAYHLATAGKRVALVDRAEFPRDKPCGGGLTLRAVRQLPFPVDPVVEHVVDSFEFRLGYERSYRRTAREPLVLMTQRRRLDAFLVDQARRAGAEVLERTRVTAVEQAGDAVAATTANGEVLEAAALVGADGVNGVTAKQLRLGEGPTYGVAFEGNVPYAAIGDDRYRGRAVFELNTVPGGYGWVFPKGDHANFGVGGWEQQGPDLRAHLRILCERHGVDPDALEHMRGHRLPLRRPEAGLARGRTLVVGDAAGLVDPVSGDGMFECFVSARIAAEAVVNLLEGRASSVEPYDVRVREKLGPLVSASWGAKVAFDRYPRLAFELTRPPFVWSVVERLIRGDLSHPGASRGPARWALKAMRAAARLKGDPGDRYRERAAA
ncbi:MAG: geranylgeranyl reductase family protein [Thermoleophilia bacterium]